jgi:hypothetical protein
MMCPEFPNSDQWVIILHWCIRVMEPGDPDIEFTASILSYCHKFDGLTEKQAKYATRILERLKALYDLGELPLQLASRRYAACHGEGTVH